MAGQSWANTLLQGINLNNNMLASLIDAQNNRRNLLDQLASQSRIAEMQLDKSKLIQDEQMARLDKQLKSQIAKDMIDRLDDADVIGLYKTGMTPSMLIDNPDKVVDIITQYVNNNPQVQYKLTTAKAQLEKAEMDQLNKLRTSRNNILLDISRNAGVYAANPKLLEQQLHTINTYNAILGDPLYDNTTKLVASAMEQAKAGMYDAEARESSELAGLYKTQRETLPKLTEAKTEQYKSQAQYYTDKSLLEKNKLELQRQYINAKIRDMIEDNAREAKNVSSIIQYRKNIYANTAQKQTNKDTLNYLNTAKYYHTAAQKIINDIQSGKIPSENIPNMYIQAEDLRQKGRKNLIAAYKKDIPNWVYNGCIAVAQDNKSKLKNSEKAKIIRDALSDNTTLTKPEIDSITSAIMNAYAYHKQRMDEWASQAKEIGAKQ